MTCTCVRCGNPFQGHRSTAKYCSGACRTAATRERQAAAAAVDAIAAQEPAAPATAPGAEPGTGGGRLERGLTEVLRQQGWSADQHTWPGFLGLMTLDMARFQDQMAPGQNKAANNRELRLTLAEYRALAQPKGGSALDDDDVPDAQRAGGDAGAPDPGGAAGGDVVPFGRRGTEAG